MQQDIHQQKIPPLPYIFQTPKGLLIDLRLFSRYPMIYLIANRKLVEGFFLSLVLDVMKSKCSLLLFMALQFL